MRVGHLADPERGHRLFAVSAELLGIEAAALAGLGRGDESADLAREALALDADERRAREALEGPGR